MGVGVWLGDGMGGTVVGYCRVLLSSGKHVSPEEVGTASRAFALQTRGNISLWSLAY